MVKINTLLGKSMNTQQHISPLNQAIDNNYNYKLLVDDSKNYCNVTNTDHRVYYLGLSLLKKVDKYNKTSEFYEIIGTIQDYKNLWSKFTIKMLSRLVNNVSDSRRIKTINNVIKFLEKYGDSIPEKEARHAERDAAWVSVRAAGSSISRVDIAASAAANAARDAARDTESTVEWAVTAVRAAVETQIITYDELLNLYIDILKERIK